MQRTFYTFTNHAYYALRLSFTLSRNPTNYRNYITGARLYYRNFRHSFTFIRWGYYLELKWPLR